MQDDFDKAQLQLQVFGFQNWNCGQVNVVVQEDSFTDGFGGAAGVGGTEGGVGWEGPGWGIFCGLEPRVGSGFKVLDVVVLPGFVVVGASLVAPVVVGAVLKVGFVVWATT